MRYCQASFAVPLKGSGCEPPCICHTHGPFHHGCQTGCPAGGWCATQLYCPKLGNSVVLSHVHSGDHTELPAVGKTHSVTICQLGYICAHHVTVSLTRVAPAHTLSAACVPRVPADIPCTEDRSLRQSRHWLCRRQHHLDQVRLPRIRLATASWWWQCHHVSAPLSMHAASSKPGQSEFSEHSMQCCCSLPAQL